MQEMRPEYAMKGDAKYISRFDDLRKLTKETAAEARCGVSVIGHRQK